MQIFPLQGAGSRFLLSNRDRLGPAAEATLCEDQVSLSSTPLPLPPGTPGVAAPPAPDPPALVGSGTPPQARGLPSVPRQFTQKEVQAYYLSADEESLSEIGRALYTRMKGKYLDPVPEATLGSPTLYFTAGLPGSGKGAVLESMWAEAQDFVLVDPDHLKYDILKDLLAKNPDLGPQMMQDREWGTVVHWTSSLLAKELLLDGLSQKKDLVFDSSMSTPDADKYRKFSIMAREQGYRINALICQVDLDKSIERADKRSRKAIQVDNLLLPGRLVTPDYIRGCNERLQANLDSFFAEGLFDFAAAFDNNGDYPTMEKAWGRGGNRWVTV